MTEDRANLEKVAELYRDYRALMVEQRATTAKLLRVCVTQLQSPNSIKRREAINALADLAVMLENAK